MTRDRRDEFYVGYLDETPPGVARFVRRIAVGLVVLVAALGTGLALLLERFDEGVFEYGTVREYRGELFVDPHPRLRTEDGPAGGYLLVAEGKHGLEVDHPRSLPWRSSPAVEVSVTGTLIQNPEAAMLEVHSLHVTGSAGPNEANRPESRPLDDGETGSVRLSVEDGLSVTEVDPASGEETLVLRTVADVLVGEIVDTKCYLGAMKPGRGKPHRDCASLCIRGGIPAALLVRTDSGKRVLVHLTNLLGQPAGAELLEWVGEPVEVTGMLRRHDDRLLLIALPHRAAPITSAAAAVRRHGVKPPRAGAGQ